MSYCRSVNEIDSIKVDWIPRKLREIYGDYTLEEFVLAVRNGTIFTSIYDEEASEGEKMYISDMIAEVMEFLIVNGFIRYDMITLSTPEAYFIERYVVAQEMIEKCILGYESRGRVIEFKCEDYLEVMMPYNYSNRDYETYQFSYEKIEAVIRILSNYLNETELYDVALDINSMGNCVRDEAIIEQAKEKMVEKSFELVPLFVQAFAIF